MKIVNIIGGLGNQMFQYALAVALENKFKEQVYLDTTMFSTYNVHNGLEIKRVFDVPLREAPVKELNELTYYTRHYKLRRVFQKLLPSKKTECIEAKDYTFNDTVLSLNIDRYYDGYWQNWRYFNDYAEEVRKFYKFCTPLDCNNEQLLDQILETDHTVSVHIRRGDYLKAPIYAGLCGQEYYTHAITYIKQQILAPIHFLIFSDDMDWCRENIEPLFGNSKRTYVDWNRGADSYKDMQLMSKCRHNIIANSSFSWWAAWLNLHADNIIIAPKKWLNGDFKCQIQMPDWVLL